MFSKREKKVPGSYDTYSATPFKNQLWTGMFKEISRGDYERAMEMIRDGANVNIGILGVPDGKVISTLYTAFDRTYTPELTAVIIAASDSDHLLQMSKEHFYAMQNRRDKYKLKFIALEAILRRDERLIDLFILHPLQDFSLSCDEMLSYLSLTGTVISDQRRADMMKFLRLHVENKISGVDNDYIKSLDDALSPSLRMVCKR